MRVGAGRTAAIGERRATRLAVTAALLAAGGPALAAAEARADEQIRAVANNRYEMSSWTIDQGERLTFLNLDVAEHNVTATDNGLDGKPLFETPLIGTNQEALVEGSRFLTTGSYKFLCTIHPWMEATLNVNAQGTPVPRPRDATAPSLGLRVGSARLARVRRSRKLGVAVTLDEAAGVVLTATARTSARGARRARTVTIAKGTADFDGPATRTVSLRLTRAGRAALKRRRRVAVAVSGRATDRAGNAASAKASRTLR